MRDFLKVIKATFGILLLLSVVGAGVYVYMLLKQKDFDVKKVKSDLESKADEFAKRAEEKIQEATRQAEQKFDKVEAGLGLSERQQEIVNFLRKLGDEPVKINLISKKFKDVSPRTIRRDINSLEELGVVEHLGSTKSSEYRLINQ